tara:strand:+ start:290 stop:667 length:378 start_codon:yes stop_codon:yes gene_type:complete
MYLRLQKKCKKETDCKYPFTKLKYFKHVLGGIRNVDLCTDEWENRNKYYSWDYQHNEKYLIVTGFYIFNCYAKKERLWKPIFNFQFSRRLFKIHYELRKKIILTILNKKWCNHLSYNILSYLFYP